MDELVVLRFVSLKGLTTAAGLADGLGIDDEAAHDQTQWLVRRGHVQELPGGGRLRITKAGRAYLDTLLEADRASIPREEATAVYEDFCQYNSALKELVSAWQLSPDGNPNLHTDAAYDTAIVERFTALHTQVSPMLDSIGELRPRLARYKTMLDRAHDRILEGQVEYIASPMLDSYHSCWFELHEELIHLCGRTRAQETAAGRA